ncbi:hypothetical protein MLD38_040341 [Melastoma candidum]|uniref:Uncharacterized protein n=1 Tax=Melastoma candidum TaxID=119954 RepID=A0ACB9L634_9MYRT|nr:hypothetical protein MLD38_040341 [Melastoma candidum]
MMKSRLLHVLMILGLVSVPSRVVGRSGCDILSVFQLGDSLTDTGNFIRLAGPANPASAAARYPYGETYGKPTGRFSNGLIIVDYFAKALQLPLINPYLATNETFDNGVVFSVSGSTAQNPVVLAEKGIIPTVTPDISLDIQVAWFKTYLASTCTSPADSVRALRRSIVFLGEIGGNDFTYSFVGGKSIEQATTDVPFVVAAIIKAAKEILQLGAKKMVVFGDFPFGCLPIYLTIFQTTNSSAYDDNGCLIAFNNFQIYRNNYLKRALSKLRKQFPNADIIYGDYYNAFDYVLNNAASFGFDPNSTLKACCGRGGPYNFNLTTFCGSSTYNLCPNPSKFISWDGIHLTQNAYYHITQYLIRQIFPQISCSVNAFTY